MKSLEIFKAGKHVASDGRVFTFSEADVMATAKAYNPALHEAPIVIGHPKSNSPAYGWAKSLTVSAPILLAEPHQVNPDAVELVKSGAVKKISASFYEPNSPDNPVPGVYYLRHIGLLGAVPPAVKGLRDAEFSADEKGVIEFMDWTDRDNASLWRGLRDWIIGKFGKDEADKVIPDYLVTSLQEGAVQATPDDTAVAGINYTESDNVETKEQKEARERAERELKARQDEHARKEVEFAEREKKLKADEAAQRRTKIVAEVDVLVAAGKVLPKDKAGLVAFMEALDSTGTIEFGEGDKKEKKPTAEWLAGFLKGLPKAVDFAARGARTGAEADESADPLVQAAQLSRRALEFQETEKKAGRSVDIASAVAHVKAQTSA